ncbi:MAG: type II secretion system F family protein [Candidatus Portnoybacteria bacterium]|nr:type II secretion system F family protein [Candidatus Portnoybacteria bacterium]
MKFNYLARTSQGETQKGTVEAVNQSVALKTLQSRNLVVIKLKPAEEISLLSKRLRIFERVKRKEVFIFFRELAILVEADVPLVQSLKALSQQIENPYFKEIVFEVANDVDGGTAFSKALSKYPKAFSAFSVNLIKSGEITGRLQDCLSYLADYLEKEYELISKVRGAMTYPAFILGAFLIVGILVMVMVIPQLTSILTEAGQELPLSTKIVIATSEFVRSWGWLILLIFVVLGVVFWRYKRTKEGKALWDKIKLKLPIFGKILRKTYLARLSDNLSALVKGGVPIIQALDISGQVIGNVVFQEIIWQARDEVRTGQSISSSLEKHKEIPPLFCQMVKTGEKTGKLDTILGKLSVFYNKEVENVVNNLSQLIEPLLLVGLGIGVAILVFSVFMPIYNLASGL